MTYHMNRLQSLPGPVQWCVSVNPDDRGCDPARIVADRQMRHPSYTFATLDAQAAVADSRAGGDLVRRRPPRLRLPRGRLPIRVRAAATPASQRATAEERAA